MSNIETPTNGSPGDEAFQESQTILPENAEETPKACSMRSYWLPIALGTFSIGIVLGLAAGRCEGRQEVWEQSKKWWNSAAKSVNDQISAGMKEAKKVQAARKFEKKTKKLRSKLGI